MLKRLHSTFMTALLLIAVAQAQSLPWDLEALEEPPATHEAPTVQPEEGVRGFFFEALPYQGKPTRAFAWYGVPKGEAATRFPAMVLLHGGGGTAFAEWVREWNRRGFAAIAVDTGGAIPQREPGKGPWNVKPLRHEWAGPKPWGDFDNVDLDPKDQWTYHAVATAVLAHSLLRSFPEVDPERTGLTGISWGGYLTSIVGSLDARYQFAVPVYGCGFLGEDSAWLKQFEKLGPERARRWLSLWDPSVYLPRGKLPMLWVSGTNDFAYPLPQLQKSYRLPKGPRSLAIRVRMKHGHQPGAIVDEIFSTASAMLQNEKAMPKIKRQGRDARRVWAQYESPEPITQAELNYTRDSGKWQERKWETIAGTVDDRSHRVNALVPEGATAWYMNLTDSRNLIVSTEHEAAK
jgi:dienelactone hydrolase